MRSAPSLVPVCLLGLAVIPLALTACTGGTVPTSSAQAEMQRKADMYDIDQIEVNWHKAASTKDVDLMMSLWADNAVFTIGGKTYTGKDQIRSLIETAAPFQPANQWESDTPAYKIKITVSGDTGTLYFECHYVDPPTKTVKVVVSANQDVARINGKCLIVRPLGTTATRGSIGSGSAHS